MSLMRSCNTNKFVDRFFFALLLYYHGLLEERTTMVSVTSSKNELTIDTYLLYLNLVIPTAKQDLTFTYMKVSSPVMKMALLRRDVAY
jgi:hypothetical protein